MTWLFIALVVALQAADAWTTIQCLDRGLGTEVNPVARWVLKRSGNVGFLAFKLVGTILLAAAFWWMLSYPLGPMTIVPAVYLMIQAAVVVNNLMSLGKL